MFHESIRMTKRTTHITSYAIILIISAIAFSGCSETPRHIPTVAEHGGITLFFNIENIDDLENLEIIESLSSLRRRLLQHDIRNFRLAVRERDSEESIHLADDNGTSKKSEELEIAESELRVDIALPTKMAMTDDDEINRTLLRTLCQPLEKRVVEVLSVPNLFKLSILADSMLDSELNRLSKSFSNIRKPTVLSDDNKVVGEWISIDIHSDLQLGQVSPQTMILRANRGETALDLPDGWDGQPSKLRTHLQQQKIVLLEVLAKVEPTGTIDSRDLKSVRKTSDTMGRPALALKFEEDSAQKLRSLSSRYAANSDNVRLIAFVLDSKLLISLRIQGSFGTDVEIDGNFSESEIDQLIRELGTPSLLRISNPTRTEWMYPNQAELNSDS